jgi:hypothetical protein
VELSRKMDDLISGNSLAYVGIVGAAEVLPMVDADLKKIAARVVEKAKELCISKSVLLLFFKKNWYLVNSYTNIELELKRSHKKDQ